MLPPSARTELDPLIVTSPATRSGTTLLQRLLCSAENARIYGETCALDLELFAQVFAAKAAMYQANRARFVRTRERVLAGATDDWILDLMPDLDGYLAALGRGCFAGLECCRDEAARDGRPVWGVKCPAWAPSTLHLLRALVPRLRFLYLHRDVLDCLRSAKAQQMIGSEPEFVAFCQTWAAGLNYVLGLGADPGVLVLSYTDLAAGSAGCLERIAAFSGARGLDPSVLAQKINTWTDQGQKYVPPADLTDRERGIALELTSALRAKLYGSSEHGS